MHTVKHSRKRSNTGQTKREMRRANTLLRPWAGRRFDLHLGYSLPGSAGLRQACTACLLMSVGEPASPWTAAFSTRLWALVLELLREKRKSPLQPGMVAVFSSTAVG